MSIETSLESLARALETHAAAISALADVLKTAGNSANSEHFRKVLKNAAQTEAEALTPDAEIQKTEDLSDPPFEPLAEQTAEVKAELGEISKKSGGNADIKAERVASADAPTPTPTREPEPMPTSAPTREPEPIPEPVAPTYTAADARALALKVLKGIPDGKTVLRNLLTEVGVEKLQALNPAQLAQFCINAEKTIKEAA
jgi:hypothetical protein